MKDKKISLFLENVAFFEALGFLAVGLGIWSVVLAALGFFYAFLIWIYVIGAAVFLGYLLYKKRSRALNLEIISLLLVVILGTFFVYHFSAFSVFSGRDQGTFSESAIRLAQNHRLSYSTPLTQEFFKIYGPGKALNFPGFNYSNSGELVTHFPIGYPAWLASFYALLGLPGLAVANAVSLALFLIFFFLLLRRFFAYPLSFLAILTLISSFIFNWFFKFTLGETLAVFLLWFSIYQLVLFIENQKNIHFLILASSLTLLFFVRIETLVFIPIVLGIIYFYRKKDWKKILKGNFTRISLLFFSLLMAGSPWFEKTFYLNFGKTLLKPFFSSTSSSVAGGGLWQEIFFVVNVFYIYAIFSFLVFGGLGILRAFRFGKSWKALIPFWVVLPTLAYLVNPGISDDHPWMLRRFMFSVAPLLVFFTVYFFDHFFKKRFYAYILLSLIIFLNLIISWPYLTFKPHEGLLEETKKISLNFSSGDLVLIDREASGDAWSMLSGPLSFLYGKQAVYFFNPDDLPKISREKFKNVFLIVPDNNLEWYQKNGLLTWMVPIREYKLENPIVDPVFIEEENKLPMKETKVTYGRIYKWIGQ